VEGVVAAEEDVVERNPLPASKCTHSKPLTPGSEVTTESPLNAPSALDGLSILYLRNSMKKNKTEVTEMLSQHFFQKLDIYNLWHNDLNMETYLSHSTYCYDFYGEQSLGN
jgi:hypothetical protein